MTNISLSVEEKAAVVEDAVAIGIRVHGEVGVKGIGSREQSATAAMIAEMETSLHAGADKVIFESDELEPAFEENVGDGDIGPIEIIEQEIDAIGAEHVVLEVRLIQEILMLDAVGGLVNYVDSDVNIGNITPNYLTVVEQTEYRTTSITESMPVRSTGSQSQSWGARPTEGDLTPKFRRSARQPAPDRDERWSGPPRSLR